MKGDVVWLVAFGTSTEVYADGGDAWEAAMRRIDAYAAMHPQFEDLYRNRNRTARLDAWREYHANHSLDAELDVEVAKREVR